MDNEILEATFEDIQSEEHPEEYITSSITGNSHYIITDATERVVSAWSDGPLPDLDSRNAICLTQRGSYQFRFSPDGEENPTLFNDKTIPLYKWNGKAVIARTAEEIATDEANLPEPTPPINPMAELQQQLLDIQMALCDVYEMMNPTEEATDNG